MTENPYAPPTARSVEAPSPPPPTGMIQELRSQGTWRLFGLGIITLGTYYAHYCARHSRIINKPLGD